MSEEGVELARVFTDAFNEADMDALVACCHPNGEFHSAFAAVGGAVYHGHDGVLSWYRDLAEALGEGVRSDLEALFDLGEYTLVFTNFYGRGKQSGAEVAMPIAAVARMREGLFIHYRAYIHREDALRDLGVSEDELEPIRP